MQAIKDVSELIKKNPQDEGAKILAGMLLALSRDEEYPILKLYELEFKKFELGLELLREWRLDRYYTKKAVLLALAEEARGAQL